MNGDNFKQLIIENWKIENIIKNSLELKSNLQLKFSLRKINSIFKNNEYEIIDLTNVKYDIGMAVEIIDKESCANSEELYINKMVEPIILHQGNILNYGKVILSEIINKEGLKNE